MQPEKDQYFIFSEAELSLIKNTFSDNDELLYAIRNVLLQFPLSDGQKATLSVGLNENVISVLRKRIIPELAPTYPLGQLPSILTTLTQELKAKDANEMAPQFIAKQLEIEYLEQQFQVLEGRASTEQVIKLADLGTILGKTPDEQYVEMTAYLFLLGYIDPMLGMIKNLAGSKDETAEEQKKRLTRDSSK
jgi:hypothetical protein